MIVYDKDGQPHEVPDADAKAGIVAGTFGVLPDQKVHAVTPTGEVRVLAGHEVAPAFAAGYSPATPEQVQAAKEQARYGGVAGKLAVGTLGPLSGATLGASDIALKALAPGAAETLEHAYRANPTETTVAKLGGAVIPSLVAGPEAEAAEGASLAARAASAVTAPARGVAAAGRGIEGAVSSLIGAGGEGSLVTRLSKAAIAKGTGFATEGALYGMADRVSEDVLGDHDLNAEKILASGATGALLGLGLGGVIGAGGELGSSVLGTVSTRLPALAEAMGLKAIGAKGGALRALDRIEGGAKGAVREALDDGVYAAGDSLETLAPKLASAREAAAGEVGKILETADKAGYEGPSVAELSSAIDRKVLAPLMDTPKLNAAAIGKVKSILEDLEGFTGRVPNESDAAARNVDRDVLLSHDRLTFQEAQQFSARVAQLAEPEAKKAHALVEAAVEDAGDKAAKGLGGSFREDYQQAKLSLQRYAGLADGAQRALESRAASGGDVGAAAIGGAALLAHGLGGPASLAGAMAAGLTRHALRERGASTAAVLLDKLASLRGVERAAAHVDEQIDRGVAGIVGGGRAMPATRGTKATGYEDRVEAVQQAVQNVEGHGARAAMAALPIAEHAPKTARAFQSAAMRAATYLASQVPKTAPVPSVTPQFDRKLPASDMERAAFIRKFDAVHDPASVLTDAAAGRMTADQVDAIRAVYPRLYAEIVEKARAKLADTKHPLDYAEKLQVGLLLGIPADPSMDPGFVALMQSSYVEQPKTQAPEGPPKKSRERHQPTEASSKNAGLRIGRSPP